MEPNENATAEQVIAAEAPTTALGAMEKAAGAASSTADSQVQVGAKPPEATSGATGQPATETHKPVAEAPERRIEAAVRNARVETEKQIREQFKWTEGLNPQEVQRATELVGQLFRDPRAFYQQLGSELNPVEDKDDPNPEPDLQTEDGRVKAYSETAVQKLLANLEKRLTRQFKPALTFAEQSQKQAQDQERIAKITEEGRQLASEAIEHLKTQPHFEEHKLEIAKALQSMNPDFRRRVGTVAALYMSYNKVLAEKVFPGIQTSAETKVKEDFARKANTSRGQAHPTNVGGDGQKPALRNQNDLARHLQRLHEAAAAS